MKELNNFRKFLNEELNEGLFDEFKKELGDVLKKVGEMAKEIEQGATSGGDGSSRATKDRQLKADAKKAGVDFKEEQIPEGTWSYGSENQMIKALEEMNNINEYSNDRDFEIDSDEDIVGTQMIISDIENLILLLKRWNNDGKTKDEYYGKKVGEEFNDSMTKNPNSIYRKLFKHGVDGKTDKILSKAAVEWMRGENDFMKFGNIVPGLNEIIKELEQRVKSKQERNFAKKNKKSELTIWDTWKEQNDAALDEVINEAKPNLKKALPTIAARNVERNNAINFDIEEMMDMVGEAGKGEGSEEAKILFKASNASDELEQALVDLQIYFEDDLGEGKEEE